MLILDGSWLTEDFPLSIDKFLPLLDILASRVCAVRRLRVLLTTKFPPGTFLVKVT
jgi:ankyrin repeat domain-containing protein 13